MAYEIKSTSYPAVKPILEIEADSLDDIASLTGMAEGSTCKVSDTTYVYDEVTGWSASGIAELPAFPTDNGNYHLKCAVTNDGAALSWVSLS